MVEERLHVDADLLVVAVDGGPGCGFAAHAGAAHAGEDGGDDLVAEGEQGGDGTGRVGRDVAAAGPAGLAGQALGAEFAEVVGGLAGCVGRASGQVPGKNSAPQKVAFGAASTTMA